MRKDVTKRIVAAALRHALADAEGMIILFGHGLTTECCGFCAVRKKRTVAERGKPRIGIDDGAAWVCRGAAPTRGDFARSIFANLDRGPEPVEAEPLCKLAGLLPCDIDEKAVPVGGDEEIEQDLALRGEQAGMDGIRPVYLANVVGDQALEELAGISAADLEDGARRQQARMTMAHTRSIC